MVDKGHLEQGVPRKKVYTLLEKGIEHGKFNRVQQDRAQPELSQSSARAQPDISQSSRKLQKANGKLPVQQSSTRAQPKLQEALGSSTEFNKTELNQSSARAQPEPNQTSANPRVPLPTFTSTEGGMQNSKFPLTG